MLKKLSELLIAYNSETYVVDILKDLDLPDNRRTIAQLIGAIRLAGYEVRKKGIWNSKEGRTVSVSVLIKQNY